MTHGARNAWRGRKFPEDERNRFSFMVVELFHCRGKRPIASLLVATYFRPNSFSMSPCAELHPGRAAVIALAGMGRDLHLAEQGVHLGDRQHAAGADRAVAGHGRGDVVEPLLEAERLVEGGELVGEVGDQALDVAAAPSIAGVARTSIARGPKRSSSRPISASSASARLEPVAGGLVELDHLGEEQRLAGDAAIGHRRGASAPAPAARARHAGRRGPARPRPRRRYRCAATWPRATPSG